MNRRLYCITKIKGLRNELFASRLESTGYNLIWRCLLFIIVCSSVRNALRLDFLNVCRKRPPGPISFPDFSVLFSKLLRATIHPSRVACPFCRSSSVTMQCPAVRLSVSVVALLVWVAATPDLSTYHLLVKKNEKRRYGGEHAMF